MSFSVIRATSPNKAGGEILDLDYKTATVTKEGIADIKTHLNRLSPDPSNPKMIQRLEDIEAGKIEITDYDKRFYTHELRELERTRTHGFSDTHTITYDEWNDLHSATLEDYKLFEFQDQSREIRTLYHPSTE